MHNNYFKKIKWCHRLDKTVTYNDHLNITYDYLGFVKINSKSKKMMVTDIGFNSRNVIYGLRKLLVFLSLLFRFMLTQGYNTKELTLLTIISIPKDSKSSLSDINNYRGISLFNSIGKLFDYIITELSGSTLKHPRYVIGFKNNI